MCSQLAVQNFQPPSPPDPWASASQPRQAQQLQYAPQMASQAMPFGSAPAAPPAYAPPQGSPWAPASPYYPQGAPYPFAGQPSPGFPGPPPIPNAPPVGEPSAPSIARVQMPGARELMQVDSPQRLLRPTSNKRNFHSSSLRHDSLNLHITY